MVPGANVAAEVNETVSPMPATSVPDAVPTTHERDISPTGDSCAPAGMVGGMAVTMLASTLHISAIAMNGRKIR